MPVQPSAAKILTEIASTAAANASDEKLQYWRTELARLINTAQPPLPKLMQNGLQRCEEHLRGEQQRREFLLEAEARKPQQ